MELRPRSLETILRSSFRTENIPTKTSVEQISTEELVKKKYQDFYGRRIIPPIELHRQKHINFLLSATYNLPSFYQALDASRPWLCYWITHSLSLMDIQLEASRKSAMVDFLNRCQSPLGGYGGGPGQIPHLATTYAAVNALVILGTEEALNSINRKTLLEFLWKLKQPDGSFEMHIQGEIDIRGAYCALSIAHLTNIADGYLFRGTGEWIVSCQTYEGGFSGCPGLEAHGGYAFCGLASLVILNKIRLIDEKALMRWLVNRQMKMEGGFQGRTNKLVDGCYSFWQGAAFPLMYTILNKSTPREHLFNTVALQEYLLICCQHLNGGLIDKPGKSRDLYHTCYTLSGLSVAQRCMGKKCVLGNEENELNVTHPLYNIRMDHVQKAIIHFGELDMPSLERNEPT